MTNMTFDAKLQGVEIHCRVTSDVDLAEPVVCFSLMAPFKIVRGGQLTKLDGGYGEIQLPHLAANEPHEFILAHADPRHKPVNRAWLPLGAYLRCADQIVELPKLPAGVRQVTPTNVEPPKTLGLIPEPTSWMPKGGRLNVSTFAVAGSHWQAVQDLAARCNLDPFVDPNGTSTTLTTDEALAPDAYRIDIKSTGIDVHFGGAQGAHYAGISLLVLRFIHDGAIPCGVIEDHPRFAWRGQHLDCARHFYHPSSIHELLDLMALLKMNRFHWHFSDDEAFRLEINSFPELWQKTCQRGERELLPGVFGGGVRSGGSYSKSDAQKLIDHGQALFIEILPEIEFPAHALAIARARPDLRDPDDVGDEVSVQGYAKNVLNPAREQTWDMIEKVSLEVAELFPFKSLHLGADELPNNTWAGSPQVVALKSQHGLESSDDVLGWALDRLARTLKSNGITSAAWEEAARGKNGGIGNGAFLFSWTGQEAGINAARAGYDIVMSPAQNVYLDMAHTDAPDDWGAAWATFISLKDTVAWSVVPDPEIGERILGVEGTFWSEFTTEDHEMQAMLAPRIFGVATKGWCQSEEIDVDKFTTEARAFCALLDKMGWRWNAACFAD